MKNTNTIQLSEDERHLLGAYKQTSPFKLVRRKTEALLLAEADVSLSTIASQVGRSPYAVQGWFRDWRKHRMSSIFSGHMGNNNAGKFTKDQRYEIQQVLQSPPSDFGLPKAFWDVPQLKTYTANSFDTVYESDRSYHYLLQFANLSFKYPDTFDRRRDEQAITERMAAIRREIKPLLHRDDWEVWASDEVRVEQEAEIRRAWLQKGERTVVKVDRKKEAQSYIGFLNQASFTCELYELSWQNSKEVLGAFERFLQHHPDKRIAVVWDNARFHKSREIREQLKRGGILERVHLIAMPPYAPDHNPIEKVWNAAKGNVANVQRETFAHTKQAFSSYIADRTFRYAI